MTNKQKIEAFEKGIKSSVTPEPLKEKMRTQLAQLKALEKESTSDKKPIETPSNEDVLAILYNADSKGWNATKAESGGDIKASDELTEKYANAVSKELKGIKKCSLSEEIFDELTDGNNHLLNEFLVWNGYYDAKTTATNKASYQRIWDKGNRQVANPEIISLGAKKMKPSSATPIKKATRNYYRNKEIKSVTVLENGKKVTYAGKDVLNGASFFKEGGVLVSKAKYVLVRNIVEVTFEDGSKDKPRNGYHIRNGATPIMEHGGLTENEIKPGNIVKYSEPLNKSEEKMLFVVKEVANDDRPRVTMQIINSNLSIPPTEVVKLSDVTFVSEAVMEKGGVVNYEKGKTYPVKKVSVDEGEKIGLENFPNFHKSGSISGMKKQYYGKDALLIQSGNYIYNVTSEPEIYFRYEKGGEVWQPVIKLVPLELEPLSSQLKAYTGDNLTSGVYVDEKGGDYSTAPGEIIVHKESGRKFEMPEKIYNHVDGFNLVHDKNKNKIVTWEEGKLVAEVKDGKLDFTNKDESISINKPKVESNFEKGFIPEKTNEKWAYIAIENKLDTLYGVAEDLEDDKTTAVWKSNQAKIEKFEGFLHRLERKYAVGGPVELPEGSLQHFENYYLKKGGKVGRLPKYVMDFQENDYKKMVQDYPNYPFYSVKNGTIQEIFSEKTEDLVAKWNSKKKELTVFNPKYNSEVIVWLKDNSFLTSDQVYEIDEMFEEEEYKLGGSLLSAWKRERKYVNKSQDYETRYAKGKNRKGYTKFSKGGKVNTSVDLFENYELQPKNLQEIVSNYNRKAEEGELDYEDMLNFQKEVEVIGYTFDYGLDNEPFGLRPIGTELESNDDENGYFAKGGPIPQKGDFAKVPVGYGMYHYGLIKEIIKDNPIYPQNGYEIVGIGDVLHPEQFEVVTESEFEKQKANGTDVKTNSFLVIEEKFEKGGKVDNKFNYMMLSRLQMDCDYYLGFGNRNEKVLWAGNVEDHVAEMKKLWNNLPKDAKPEWLSMEDILDYEKKMKNDEFEKGGVLSKGDNVKHLETKKEGTVISIRQLNGLEDEVIVEFKDGSIVELNSFDVEKILDIKANLTYDPNSGLTFEEWKAKHNIQNYGKGGKTDNEDPRGANFRLAKEIRKPGERWQDAVSRATKMLK